MKSGRGSGIMLMVATAVMVIVAVEYGFRSLHERGYFPLFFSKFATSSPPWNRKDGPGLYYGHPYSAYAIKPGYQSADSDVAINSLGFRGPDISPQKPPSTFRIVAMGGSTTYGILLPQGKDYPRQLESKLKSLLNTNDLEVINAGLVSATTAETLHRLYTEILPLQPDMVIIYHGFNDLVPRMFDHYSADYYHFRKIPTADGSFLDSSYLYRLALRALWPTRFYENFNLPAHTWKLENLPDSDNDRVANFDAAGSEVFSQNIQHIINVLRANRVKVVLATFAFEPAARHWYPAMPDELWERGIRQNNKEIETLASRNELPLVDFHAWAQKDPKMFRDSIHMNEYGAEKQAEYFAAKLEPHVSRIMRPGYVP
ncbi:MAG: SGNH/GDSL hydrolase family protein [bacterium]